MGSALVIAMAGAVTMLVCGAAFWATAVVTVRGRLSRNSWWGIRTVATTTSDAAWEAGHRAALPVLRITAGTCVGLGVLLAASGLASAGSVWVVAWFLVGCAVLAVGSVWMTLVADRAARRR